MMQLKLQETVFLRSVLDFLLSLEDTRIFLVGGAVRDALLGKTSHDLDFIVDGDALTSARKLANHIKGAFYTLDSSRNYARVIGYDEEGIRTILDFAPLYQNNIQADLQSRDFTINAIAWNISAKKEDLIDPLHGFTDLEKSILRPCSDHSFIADPVRMIRTARFAVEYKMEVNKSVRDQIHNSISKLAEVSEERKRDELFKIFENHNVADALVILHNLNVLELVFPEVQKLVDFQQGSPHQFDGWFHTLQAVRYCEAMLNYIDTGETNKQLLPGMKDIYSLLDGYSDGFKQMLCTPFTVERTLRALILFAALYHDVGKPLDIGEKVENRVRYNHHSELGAKATESRAKRMALSKLEIQWLECFINTHMLLHDLNTSAGEAEQRIFLYHFYRAAQQASPFVVLFSLADLLATYHDTLLKERWQIGLIRCEKALNGWFREYNSLVAPEPFLNGDDLQKEFHLKPGKIVGVLLHDLCEAQVAGEITSKRQAGEWVNAWIHKINE
ncbi:MAG: HD domain-containing protein [Anaerolineaceae bacterium]